MKSQLSFTAIGLVLATAALGFAAVGHLPGVHPRETVTVSVAGAKDGPPHRIDCFIGMRGEPGSLYRGWICEREQAPTLAN